MELVLTKNNLVDLNVFFYKKGFTNIHRPFISMLKIDSAMKTSPIFHIGFKDNMGFTSGNKIYSGVMVFEVLEGYPMQSLMFTNNSNPNKVVKYQQSLEDLEIMDFYCIQKKNKDPYGDFVLKNVKFIDTRMTQSTQDYARRIIATFVCSDKIPFRFPYFFNEFKSDNYSSHLVRKKEEIEAICKDFVNISDVLTKEQIIDYYKILSREIIIGDIEIYSITNKLKELFEEVINDFVFRKTMKRYSAIFRIRDFIAVFYKFRNEYVYSHPNEYGRGDLDFLKFMDLDVDNWIKSFKGELNG